MKGNIYSLKGNLLDSNDYYKKATESGKKIFSYVSDLGKNIISDYMVYIDEKKIEVLRSKEDYSIELLFIGVIIKEYLNYGRAFKKKNLFLFTLLNKSRDINTLKSKVDIVRGKLNYNMLLKKKESIEELNTKDLINIIYWMEASGDFKEELIRLRPWMDFIQNKGQEYFKDLIEKTTDMAEFLLAEGRRNLQIFIKNLGDFLKNYKKYHINKEDIIYCGKGEIQYYFNMVSAQYMNNIYRNSFLESSIKKAFIPSCMKKSTGICKSKISEWGEACRGCSEVCNVNKLSQFGRENGFKVYIIPHETMLFKKNNLKKENIGVIGIACLVNLMSGGWKALRLGFNPQCVVLEHCGCSNHWLKEPIMTEINMGILKEILRRK